MMVLNVDPSQYKGFQWPVESVSWHDNGAVLGRARRGRLRIREHRGPEPEKSPAHSIVANCDDGQAHTAPVGSYKPNPWGIYDILGNVAEWVEDCYAEDYRKAPTNGSATTTSDCTRRIVRSGSWYISPRVLRAANRIGGTPGGWSDSLGFRLARTVTP